MRPTAMRVAKFFACADVLCYALALANELELDIATTLLQKMEKNRQKYPTARFRGRYGANDPNPPALDDC